MKAAQFANNKLDRIEKSKKLVVSTELHTIYAQLGTLPPEYQIQT
jgi:hypothetical protein